MRINDGVFVMTLAEPAFIPALSRAVAIIGSQDKAALAIGVSQMTISRWLRGEVRRLPYDVPSKFEQATDGLVKAGEFLG